jgi:hypothetical protein
MKTMMSILLVVPPSMSLSKTLNETNGTVSYLIATLVILFIFGYLIYSGKKANKIKTMRNH